jgi:hypothetical protein
MPRPDLGAHFIAPNESSRMPRNFVYLDTEARVRREPGREIQDFRLAVAASESWSWSRQAHRPLEWGGFDDVERLWEWVGAKARQRARTVLVAHNLAYDLRTSRAFVELPAAGWTCERVRLDHGAAFARWRRDTASLVMVDLFSWLPASLDEIGRRLKTTKPELPDVAAGDVEWLARCVADVEITRAAWRRIFNWMLDVDLGTWQPTGAGQAWAAWRHKFLDYSVIADRGDEWREAERESAWTGRCEAWRHGSHIDGPYAEWDYRLAYARIGAECAVPVRPAGHPHPANVGEAVVRSRSHASLCRVRITTDAPVAPAKIDGRIVWPVGTFTTTLWSHELALAVEAGADVEVEWIRPYTLRPALRSFMDWAIPLVEARDDDDDQLVGLMVKQWTRSLVGRFGMRYRTWDCVGVESWDDCVLALHTDLETGVTSRILQVGRDVLVESELVDFDDGVPAIMAYVMAEARVRLWHAMQAAGLGELLYVDTDALIVTPRGDRRLEAAASRGELPGLRRKNRYSTVDIFGPRQLVAGAQIHAAGVPRKADRVDERTFRFEAWRSLAESLRRREPDRVTVVDRHVVLRGTDRRRVRLPDGSTTPVLVADGILVPPAEAGYVTSAGTPKPRLRAATVA